MRYAPANRPDQRTPAAMTNFRSSSTQYAKLADNVIVFPGARRACSAASVLRRQDRQTTDLAGADLNLRLLGLLGICVTSAILVVSAIRVLHG